MPRRMPFDPQPKIAPSIDEPIRAHLRRPPADGVVCWHQHRWGQLAWPRRGSIRVSAPGIMWIVPPFRAAWVPPGIDHEIVLLGCVELHVLYVEPTASPLSLADCSVIECSALMWALADSLAAGSDVPKCRRQLMTNLMIEEIRDATALPSGLPLPTERRLRALCDAMIEDPGSTNTLAQWSVRMGASERTLARLFQTELRTTFAVWRQQLRLARATDLIAQGMPLGSVATELGYSNAPAFSSMFKRTFGFPPSKLVNGHVRSLDHSRSTATSPVSASTKQHSG